jgi:anti-anti-sigma factor
MQQGPNEIRLRRLGEVTLLDIKGDITSFSEPFFDDAYQDPSSRGAKKILFNFDDKAYINSGGIAVLIQVLAQSKRNNQTIALTGLSEHFKKIFHMLGITQFAAIHPTVEDALKAMS